MRIVSKTTLWPVMLVLIILGSMACIQEKKREVMGFKPVYKNTATKDSVSWLSSKMTTVGGKIYQYGNRYFQVEQGSGIHVMEGASMQSMHKIGFLAIEGCNEISIRQQVLYTDNLGDLVGIDIQDITKPKLLSRIDNAFPYPYKQSPPERGYFECVDPSKGQVIGWEKTMLINPKCKK